CPGHLPLPPTPRKGPAARRFSGLGRAPGTDAVQDLIMKRNRKLVSQQLLRDNTPVVEGPRPAPAVHSDAVGAAWDEPGPHPEADESDAGNETDELEGPSPSAAEGEDGHGADDALGLYLRQMGAIPLLNREQELALARRLETARQRYRRAALMSWRTLQR